MGHSGLDLPDPSVTETEGTFGEKSWSGIKRTKKGRRKEKKNESPPRTVEKHLSHLSEKKVKEEG